MNSFTQFYIQIDEENHTVCKPFIAYRHLRNEERAAAFPAVCSLREHG
jgi:hypothetical protein